MPRGRTRSRRRRPFSSCVREAAAIDGLDDLLDGLGLHIDVADRHLRDDLANDLRGRNLIPVVADAAVELVRVLPLDAVSTITERAVQHTRVRPILQQDVDLVEAADALAQAVERA